MTYILAEIGQNHQGSVEVARDLIDMASDPRPADLRDAPHYSASAVKLTKRDLDYELAPSLMARTYTGRNSFGATYREHRERLELSDQEHADLYHYAKSRGLQFIETLCAPSCVSLLGHFTPDRLKVASRDLTNLPLIEALAETGVPMILSTGMHGDRELDAALAVVTRQHDAITILHCTSTYPTPPEAMALSRLRHLTEAYPYPVGLSDHSIGINMATAAVAMGAEVVEKHVTLDRMMRGSDHAGSLERDGLWRMLRDLNALDRALSSTDADRLAAARGAREKLERSLHAARSLPSGHVVEESDLVLLSPGGGLPWSERNKVVGQAAARDIAEGEQITEDSIRGWAA